MAHAPSGCTAGTGVPSGTVQCASVNSPHVMLTLFCDPAAAARKRSDIMVAALGIYAAKIPLLSTPQYVGSESIGKSSAFAQWLHSYGENCVRHIVVGSESWPRA